MLSRELEELAALLAPHRRAGLRLEAEVVGSLVAIFRALALQAHVMEQMTVPAALRGDAAKLGANVVRLKPRGTVR